MGSRTDADLAAFAAATGIKPAKGRWLQKLKQLQQLALDLIRIAELERSGIRDGAGKWISSDALGGTIEELRRVWASDGSNNGAAANAQANGRADCRDYPRRHYSKARAMMGGEVEKLQPQGWDTDTRPFFR